MRERDNPPNGATDMTDMITEEHVVSKVQELMETLDSIKRYNAFATSLKKFTIIIVGFMTIFSIIVGLIDFYNLSNTLERPIFFSISSLALLIPISGIIAGILFVRRNVNAVKTEEWKEELSQGFPSALKMLIELDWNETFNEISMGKISYVLYGLMKTVAYWIVTFFALRLIGTAFSIYFFQRVESVSWFVLGVLALLIVLFTLGNDLLKRYKEILSLDMLLMELRWFSFEFRKAEF
ncbi:MAG: hypothetical protein NWF06_04520 [Candidatus Bathyarchaeota archaeon]|nr:hypothetical protein [Candidatus Bathyarchaeum sp.]